MIAIIKVTPPWAVLCLTAVDNFLQSWRKRTTHVSLWGRALGSVAAGLILTAATTADARVTPMSSPFARQADPRIARLETFFRNYHCAAPYHTTAYLRAADGYRLDYRLLPAVSIRETLCGATAGDENNFWGYHPGHQSFDSIEAGIDFLAQRLAQHRLYRGKTLREKLFTYNPRAAYVEEVGRIMRQIE